MSKIFIKDMWVTCLPGFHNGRSAEPKFAGRGYAENLTFRVDVVNSVHPLMKRFGTMVIDHDRKKGTYTFALREATPEEIKKVAYKVVRTLWGKRKTVRKDMNKEEAHRHTAVMRRTSGYAVEYHSYPMSTKPSEYI